MLVTEEYLGTVALGVRSGHRSGILNPILEHDDVLAQDDALRRALVLTRRGTSLASASPAHASVMAETTVSSRATRFMYATPSFMFILIELSLFVPECNEIETKGNAFLVNQNQTTNTVES